MIPRCYPVNSKGFVVVAEVNPSGKTEWSYTNGYIPVQVVGVPDFTDKGAYDANGYMRVQYIVPTTEVEWEDYIPVDTKTGRAGAWKVDATSGYIPISTMPREPDEGSVAISGLVPVMVEA